MDRERRRGRVGGVPGPAPGGRLSVEEPVSFGATEASGQGNLEWAARSGVLGCATCERHPSMEARRSLLTDAKRGRKRRGLAQSRNYQSASQFAGAKITGLTYLALGIEIPS
ncbi:MAG: hypothetical protein OXE92_05410 [Bacteroidetes bacterium]|nr:hypothetical protein [Bacteroidota bacterium]